MNKTYVISAFPGCGKTYYYNTNNTLKTLDSDSSNFSWIKDSNGNNTTERNPEFPNNYIKHIKDNIGKVDIIFVSSHDNVRQSLYANKIPTILVYPNKSCKDEWLNRFKNRGNDDKFIQFMSDNWDKFIDALDNEANECIISKKKLNSNQYINTVLHSIL